MAKDMEIRNSFVIIIVLFLFSCSSAKDTSKLNDVIESNTIDIVAINFINLSIIYILCIPYTYI